MELFPLCHSEVLVTGYFLPTLTGSRVIVGSDSRESAGKSTIQEITRFFPVESNHASPYQFESASLQRGMY